MEKQKYGLVIFMKRVNRLKNLYEVTMDDIFTDRRSVLWSEKWILVSKQKQCNSFFYENQKVSYL